MGSLGIQYVRPDGSDSNHGETWVKAKQTIEAAQGDLPDAWPTRGGTIYLSAGLHAVHELDLTVRGTTIIGAGRAATTLRPSGLYGLEIQEMFVTVQSLQITATSAAPFYGQALRVVSDRNATLRDIWFHQLGKDYDGTNDIDVAPAAVWVGGLTEFSDWHLFTGISVWGGYRGLVNAGSANFVLSDSDINTVREGLIVVRRDVSANENAWGGTVQANTTWFTGGQDYLVRLEADPGAPNVYAATSLNSCIFEPIGSAAGTDHGHVWCGLSDTRIVGSKFIGGSHSTNDPHAVCFDAESKNCVVTGFARSGGGFGMPGFYGNTAAQTILEP